MNVCLSPPAKVLKITGVKTTTLICTGRHKNHVGERTSYFRWILLGQYVIVRIKYISCNNKCQRLDVSKYTTHVSYKYMYININIYQNPVEYLRWIFLQK